MYITYSYAIPKVKWLRFGFSGWIIRFFRVISQVFGGATSSQVNCLLLNIFYDCDCSFPSTYLTRWRKPIKFYYQEHNKRTCKFLFLLLSAKQETLNINFLKSLLQPNPESNSRFSALEVRCSRQMRDGLAILARKKTFMIPNPKSFLL